MAHKEEEITIDYLAIGQRIRAARKKRNLSQEQLAERANVGTTHISHIETGNTKLSIKTFIGIVNALNVSSDELLCDNVENSREIYLKKIDEIFCDCNNDELRFVINNVKYMLSALRTYAKKL